MKMSLNCLSQNWGQVHSPSISAAFLVARTKSNVLLQRRYSRPVDKATGIRSDYTVTLTAIDSAKAYPDALRRVSYLDVETGKRFKFLTNNFTLPALTIARICKVYVLVAIVRKRLELQMNPYQILQILSVTHFEKTPILQVLQPPGSQEDLLSSGNQLIRFEFHCCPKQDRVVRWPAEGKGLFWSVGFWVDAQVKPSIR
jgi:hypothetical protein